MANIELLKILTENTGGWNKWRSNNSVKPDLHKADLHDANLSGADLRNVDLSGAYLNRADLTQAKLSGADLREADLTEAYLGRVSLNRANLTGANLTKASLPWANLKNVDLIGANLTEAHLGCAQLNGAYLNRATLAKAYLGDADLSRACLKYVNLTEANLGRANLFDADLSRADLSGADFTGANLSGANLIKTTLIETRFQGANLTGCKVFGVAAWKVDLDRAKQQNLTITAADEPTITVDNLEVAQFIYLLLNNHKIRDVIDSITSKAVLILGRFTPGRKIVLDLLREELRKYNYLPIVFDFDKPASRNLTETVSTLAHMARFVIADITDAKSIPQELQRIVPHLPSLPVQPLILSSQYEYGMFKDFLDYPWVLAPYRYDSIKRLLPALSEKVIVPAIIKAKEIEDKHKDLERG